MSSFIARHLPVDVIGSARAKRSTAVQPWQVAFVRELTDEDLITLHSVSGVARDPKAPLRKIRDPHHTLAKMLAAGDEVVKIASITGYSPARIRTLEADPAFQELVQHYALHVAEASNNFAGQIMYTAAIANAVLVERLEDEPDTFTNKELLAIRDSGADRTGHGPKSTQSVEINNPSAMIEALVKYREQERQGRVIDRTEIEAEFTEIINEQAKARDGLEVGESPE